MKHWIVLALLIFLGGCDGLSNLQWAGTWGGNRTPEERRQQREERRDERGNVIPRPR